MKKTLLTLICALFYIPISVQATVWMSESFDSRSVGQLSSGASSGMGANNTNWWYTIATDTKIQVVSGGLTYSGYKSSSSTNAISLSGNTNKDLRAFKTSGGYAVPTNGKVYLSFLINVTTPKTGPDYFICMNANARDNVTAGNCYMKVNAIKDGDTQFKLGVAKCADSNNESYMNYSDALDINETYLIIVEYEQVSGDNNDNVRLYINPTKANPGTPYLTTVDAKSPAEIQMGSSKSVDASTFYNVYLKPSSSTPTMKLDEIRVATAWDDLWEEDLTPSVTAPEPEKSDVTTSSATISWDAVEDADSYTLQWKVNGGSYSDDIDIDKDVRSYSMTDLESETKYYVRVKTIIGEDESDWAEINFTTSSEPSTIDYQDITFNKYSTQDAMPTSGTYYLAKNVVEYDNVTLTDNLTLNLHGKQLYMYGTHIVVPSGVIFTIYDDAGDGEISGGYAGSFAARGIITVEEGGTLIIGEGNVINQDDEYEQVAIHNNGTLKLSGAPVISGNKTDIYLGTTITIEYGKPLTNATPYKVYKATGSAFTSGWVNMSGESPKDYFSSTNVGNSGICLNASGEAQIVPALSLSESSTNTSIASNSGQLVNASFTRSLTSSQYNTFCLPFALTEAQMEEVFGAGYDLEELTSSSLDGDLLELGFTSRTALAAGKPYLLKPASDVANPSFEGVTIAATSPVDIETSFIDFKGVYAPTELTGGNKNLLFLGAENELFWPEATGNLKGFRAYFEVKGGAAKVAKRARIVNKEDSATGIENINQASENQKFIRNGQLYIRYNGAIYNIQGQRL